MKTMNHNEWKFNIGKVELKASIAPCCWMYNSDLQVRVEMVKPKGGDVHLNAKTPYKDATPDMVPALFKRIKLIDCRLCGSPAFDPKHVSTNRDGMCEKCFLDKIMKDLDVALKEEAELLRLDDEMARENGFKYRAEIWIHPTEGGDDYKIHVYYQYKPTEKDVQRTARTSGSCILNDFKVSKL